MNVIADTSVWSLAIRQGDGATGPVALELRRLLSYDAVEMIGPIRQELLSGIREEQQFERLCGLLAPFADLPLCTDDYVTAARFCTCAARTASRGRAWTS